MDQEKSQPLRKPDDSYDLVQSFKINAKITTNGTIDTIMTSNRAQSSRPQELEIKWERQHPLGAGTFGEVELQQVPETKESRAVKEVKKPRNGSNPSVDPQRELIALSKLQKYKSQEVTVIFFGWYEDNSKVYIAMEYFPRGDLSKYMQKPIPEEEVKQITINLLTALRIAHKEHVTHRDIKPENIFVSQKPPEHSIWWVKLGDFGASKRAPPGQTALRTEIGTKLYQAPEIDNPDRSSSEYDNLVDMWSLGCVIYQLLSNTLPFPNVSDRERFYSGDKPFPDTALQGRVGADGEIFIQRLLAPRPENRPSAEEALGLPWLLLKTAEPRLQKAAPPQRAFVRKQQNQITLGSHLATGDISQPHLGTQNPRKFIRSQNLLQTIPSGTSPQPGDPDNCVTLPGHSGAVWRVEFSPDGQLLASASEDSTIRLWNPAEGNLYRILRGHSDSISDIVFLSDNQLASASMDTTIRIWKCTDESTPIKLEGHSKTVLSIAYSPKNTNTMLVSASADSTLRLWNVDEGSLHKLLQGHSDQVTAAVFFPDGSSIVSGSLDRTVRIWGSETGNLLRVLDEHPSSVENVAFSPDGATVAVTGHFNQILLWDVKSWGKTTIEGHEARIRTAIFSPDGKYMLSAANDKTVRLWNMPAGDENAKYKPHENAVTLAVAFSGRSRCIASASADKTILITDLEKGTVRPLRGHTDAVQSVTFSPNGKHLASASKDQSVKLWSIS
ncbi:hypothetical protein MauCBS54593_003094 [Microsporum audouinii]